MSDSFGLNGKVAEGLSELFIGLDNGPALSLGGGGLSISIGGFTFGGGGGDGGGGPMPADP